RTTEPSSVTSSERHTRRHTRRHTSFSRSSCVHWARSRHHARVGGLPHKQLVAAAQHRLDATPGTESQRAVINLSGGAGVALPSVASHITIILAYFGYGIIIRASCARSAIRDRIARHRVPICSHEHDPRPSL